MKNSYKFEKLKRTVENYVNKIPALNIYGIYNDSEKESYRKSVVFIHSEIETYLEKLCVDVIEEAIRIYDNKKQITKPIGYLLYRAERDTNKRNQPIDTYISEVVNEYKSKITGNDGNHGIKEPNIKSMLRPIGYELILKEKSNLMTDFIVNINTLGSDRGFFAHSSKYDNQIVSYIKPSDFRILITKVLEGLEHITDEIRKKPF